jgi:peptidoglycan/LPS O-acetylase OafA/YrhL
MRSQAIDLIKGIAIVAVICLHTLSPGTLDAIGAQFYLWQAVPVFVFVMGLNATSSLRRRGGRTMRELYSRDYLAGRFDRVYVPFLIAFLVTLALALLTQTPHSSAIKLPAELLVGLFPIDGPGNYYVTLLFQFVLLFPLVYWGLRRRPRLTLAACLAIELGFEVLGPWLGFYSTHTYLFSSCILRFLFLVALGGWFAGVPTASALRQRWLWCGGLLSVAYLALVQGDPAALSFAGIEQPGGDALVAFYPACLVLLGMALLPASGGGLPLRGAGELGRASYHIFLLQIAWFGFGLIAAHSLWALLGNLAVTLSAGFAFYELMAIRSSARTYRTRPAWLRRPRRASSGP